MNMRGRHGVQLIAWSVLVWVLEWGAWWLTAEAAASSEAGAAIDQQIDAALAGAGQQSHTAATPANLEDVFVAVTRNGAKREARAA